MEIIWLDRVGSTQTYLLDKIKSEVIKQPTLIATLEQTAGIGSRGNQWISDKGNLFFSFSFQKNTLPQDLPLSAASIYFSMLLKSVLASMGSAVWVKWPNDFYIDDGKVGGTITNISHEFLVCGIGLNLKKREDIFQSFDCELDSELILEKFIILLKNPPSWKMVLKNFEIEFERSKKFYTHYKNETFPLKDATLCEDGALMIDNQRIYSLR